MAQMVSAAAKAMTPISAFNPFKSGRAHSGSAGFTLLEILLVLTILGMASVLVVPNLGSLEIRTFNAQVRGAMALLNYARRTAVVQGQPTSANFYSADFDATEMAPARFNTANWQAGSETSIRYRDSTEQETEVDDVLVINFYPEGGSSGGTLLLQQEDQEIAIQIDPFTGRITSNVVSE